MFQPEFRIHGGHNGKEKDTNAGSHNLHTDITEGVQILGGAGDYQAAKGGGNDAKQK